jgi:succinoglycan biosynthesis transport protein ExoP
VENGVARPVDEDVTNLSDHLAILRRRWKLLVIGLLVGVGLALGMSSLETPMYKAESTLLLEPDKTTTSPTIMDPDEVATQASVIASVGVAERVLNELKLDDTTQQLLKSVKVSVIDQTRTVAISAERRTAAEAADVANSFARQYIAFRSDTLIAANLSTRTALLSKLSTLRAQLDQVRQDLANNPGDRQRQQLEAMEAALVGQEADLQVQVTLLGTDAPTAAGGHVLLEAQAPKGPSQPRPMRAAALGGILGLILGTLLAYARDRFDDGIRDETRLKLAAGTVPVLGRIPEEPGKDHSRLITLRAPTSSGSEAFRTLTSNIRFLSAVHSERPEGPGELLVVSSSVSGEGKTTIASNVAVTAARVGLRVLLVDADLRAPKIDERFGIETPIGLSHLLAGQAKLDEALMDVGVDNLQVIGAGAIPPNPAELLAGPHAQSIWHELRQHADLVVVDTAPILGVADTLELVREADTLLIVTRYKSSRVHQLSATLDRVRQVGGSVDGVAWGAVPGKEATYGYGASGSAAPE